MVNYTPVEGDDFRLVHNPHAKWPVPRGFFKRGREYWLEGDEIMINNWNDHSKSP
jgi:hypothetical protein